MSKVFVTINHFLVIFNELKIHVPVKEIHVQLTSTKRGKKQGFLQWQVISFLHSREIQRNQRQISQS